MIENKKNYLEAVALESMKNLKDYMESLKKEREEKKLKEETEQNLANQRRESVALERQNLFRAQQVNQLVLDDLDNLDNVVCFTMFYSFL